MEQLLAQCGVRSNVADGLTHGVTAHSRTDGEHTYVFVENYSDKEAPAVFLREPMEDLLTGKVTDCCELPPYGFGIFKK